MPELSQSSDAVVHLVSPPGILRLPGANYAWSVQRRRNHQAGQGYAMGALGRGCDVWRWKHTVVSTFISRGYSEGVAVIVVARGGYVTAE